MPKVYDNNGTTSTELKKIYDWNGSVATQIKNAYDWNGTAASRVYQSNITYYPGSAVYGATGGSPSNYGYFWAQTTNSSGGFARAYIAVNLTGINQIQVSYSYYANAYTYIFIGVCSGFTSNLPTSMQGREINIVYKSDNSSVSGGTTTTINVSGLSGTHYIAICTYSGSSVQADVYGAITSVVQTA